MNKYKTVGLFDYTPKINKSIEEMSLSEMIYWLREVYLLPSDYVKKSDAEIKELLLKAIKSGALLQ
jgi:hypothetical protein